MAPKDSMVADRDVEASYDNQRPDLDEAPEAD